MISLILSYVKLLYIPFVFLCSLWFSGFVCLPLYQNRADLISVTLLFSHVSRSIWFLHLVINIFFLASFGPVLLPQWISGSSSKIPLKTAGWDFDWNYREWQDSCGTCLHHGIFQTLNTVFPSTESLFYILQWWKIKIYEDLVCTSLGVLLALYCSGWFCEWGSFLFPSSSSIFFFF